MPTAHNVPMTVSSRCLAYILTRPITIAAAKAAHMAPYKGSNQATPTFLCK